MKKWLIGYDITDSKRLQRAHRILIKYATPIEYSIFLLSGSDRDRQKCLDELTAIIDPSSDDLRCYPLPERGLQLRIGKPTLPAGIYWSELPSEL